MQKAIIDLSKNGIIPVFHAKQGDTSRRVAITLLDNGLPYDTAADAVSVWYSGPSGEGNYSDGIEKDGSTLTLLINPNMTAASGRHTCAVMLSNESGRCTTWNFCVEVAYTPALGSEEAKAYFEAFEAGELAADIAAVDARTAKAVAELNARVSAIIASGTATEGNTELIDIRTGADGNVYQTAGDAVRGQIGELKGDLDKIEEDVYSSSNTPISIYESVSGWKLNESDGLCSSNNAYKIVKFNITAGKLYNISGSERFQFQSVGVVPASGTSYRIGITYQSDGNAIAPIGAEYLIISALAEANVTVKVLESLPKKINSYVSKNLCGLDPNILYPVNINVGDELTFSTENGVLYPNDNLNVLFFDSNKQYIGSYSLLANTNVRTIKTVISAKYITFNNKPTVPVQVEFGHHSEYTEYVFTSNYVKSIVDNGYYNLYPLTNGSWRNNDLTTGINTKLRLTDFAKVKAGDIIEIDNGSFVYAVGLWDSNMNRYRSDSIWNEKSERLKIEKDGYLMIVFKKSSDEIIGINDFDGSIKFYIRDISKGIIDGNDEMYIDNKKISVYNPYKNKRTNKYKGQLHCHTTNSDGKWSVDKTMSKYSEAGYDFITITDHNSITEEPNNLYGMVWLGNSLEDTNNVAGKQHCNIIGAKSVVGKYDMYTNSNTVDSMVEDYVKGQGAILQYNHPDDVTVYASNEDLDNMPDGISFIEIYNGCDGHSLTTIETTSELPYSGCQWNANYYCKADGKTYVNRNSDADSMVNVWDYNIIRPVVDTERGFTHLLDAGHKVFGTATDDCHFISTFNYGWVQVFTDRRNKSAIMNGLLSGNFYASCGVELSSVFVEDGVYEINIEGGENAVTTFYGYGLEVLKTCNGSKANYEFNGNEKYVRAVVEIDDKKAWTQPVWLLNSKYNYEF